MTATELRAQLRAQQGRNSGATTGLDAQEKVASVADEIASVADCPNAGIPQRATGDTGNDPGARYRWVIVYPDGNGREVCCLPEMTRGELSPCYPGARLVPLPDAAADAAGILSQHAYETMGV